MTEPTKVCSRCKRRLPWSAFSVYRRWPDGTVRQPYSRCKKCWAKRRRSYARSHPDRVADSNRRYWAANAAKINRARREKAALRAALEGRPFRAVPARRRYHDPPDPRLPIGPFAEWFDAIAPAYGGARPAGDALGVDPRVIRAFRAGERQTIALSVADTAITRHGDHLSDVYPSLYDRDEAAA